MLPGLVQRLRERWPCEIVAAWDSGGETFRHRMFPAYKGHRKEAPMAQEFVRAEAKAWQRMNLDSYAAVDAEADDAAATLAKHAELAGRDVMLVSSDKDWAQLIRAGVELMAPPDWEVRDAVWVQKKFGVSPDQMPDYLALAGDASDGLAGVPGIGPVAARGLLEEYGKLEAIYHPENLGALADGLRAKLEAGRSAAFMGRMLARLRDDVELKEF
jgi:DNA polymerase-1